MARRRRYARRAPTNPIKRLERDLTRTVKAVTRPVRRLLK